jgi:son of sevenless-like protein
MESISPRDRVLLSLNYWMREYFSDFTVPMRKQLSDFLAHARAIHDTPTTRLVLDSFENQIKSERSIPNEKISDKIVSKDLLKIGVPVIAKELVLIQFQLFRKIQPVELTNHRWISKDKTIAPNVQAFVEQFNRLTYWVASEILERKHLQDRVSAIQHFISIANESLKLRNFHTVFAIVAALQSHPVFRLKELKGAFTTFYQKSLDNLIKVTSSDENYKGYRPLYRQCITNNLPCIPHLAIAFKDLSVFEETTPYERQNNVIDIHRLQKISGEIHELLSCAQQDYATLGIRSLPKLQIKLKFDIAKAKNLDQLLKRSMQLEPKRTWQQHREHVQQLAIDKLLEEGFL